jgi:hypothetical protein
MLSRRSRVVAVILVAACAAIAARVAAPSDSHHFRFSAALACGVERWGIKTLKDRPRLLRARPTTVAHLTALPRPAYLPPTRLLFERRIFTVIARSDARPARGRPRLPPRPAQRLAHDDRREALAALHQGCDLDPAQADELGAEVGTSLCQGACGRSCLFRLPPRADWCRPKRDRAPSRPRLRLPLKQGPCTASASVVIGRRTVRGFVSDAVHRTATSRPRLWRHPLPQLPRAVGCGRP